MKDKELFEQLHKLSKMKPDASWKASQRSIMLNQININSEDIQPKSSFYATGKLLFSYVNAFSQPLAVTAVVAFILLTGGFVSLKIAQGTKPGDSLYVAKIVGEKTQFALTFSEKKKAQLGLEFALNRAEEIKQVLDNEKDKKAKDDKVEKLAGDFRKELDAAKTRIAKISGKGEDTVNDRTADDFAPAQVSSQTPSKIADNAGKDSEGDGEDGMMFSAGNDKTDKGLSLSAGTGSKSAAPTTASGTAPTAKIPDLGQASALIQKEALNEAVNVLEKASDAIEQNIGKAEDTGTSTPK